MTVARLQRYALFPAAFKYSIEYKNATHLELWTDFHVYFWKSNATRKKPI